MTLWLNQGGLMRGALCSVAAVLICLLGPSCDGPREPAGLLELSAQSPPCPAPTVRLGNGGACALPADALCLTKTLRIDTPGIRLVGQGQTVTNCLANPAPDTPAILVTAPDVKINDLGIDGFFRSIVVWKVTGGGVKLVDLDVRSTKDTSTTTRRFLATGITIFDSRDVLVADSTFSLTGISVLIQGDSHRNRVTGNTQLRGAGITVISIASALNLQGIPSVVPIFELPVVEAGGDLSLLRAGYRSNKDNASGVHVGPFANTIDANVISSVPPYSGIAVLDEASHTVVSNNLVTPRPDATPAQPVSSAQGIFLTGFPGVRTEPGTCGGVSGGVLCVGDGDCAAGVACVGARSFNVPLEYDASSDHTTITGNTVLAPAVNGVVLLWSTHVLLADNLIEGGSNAALTLVQHGVDGGSVVTRNVIRKSPAAEAAPPNFNLAVAMVGATVAGRTPTGYDLALSENQITGRVGLNNFSFAAELSSGGIGNLWTQVGCDPMTSLLTRIVGPPPTVECGPPASPSCTPPPAGVQDSHQLASVGPAVLCQ
jgi:hypothetical protein